MTPRGHRKVVGGLKKRIPCKNKLALLIAAILVVAAFAASPAQAAWTWKFPTPQGNDLIASYFVNTTRGWAVGMRGAIIRTSDGGTTWSAQESGTQKNLYGIYCVTDFICYAAGEGGVILKTTDGGNNWSALVSGVATDLFGVSCPADATTCYVTGAGGVMLKTIDGGVNWPAQTSNTAKDLYAISCPMGDNSNCYAAGASGTVVKTINAGTTWGTLTTGTAIDLFSIECPQAATPTTCFAAGTGNVFKTSDSGLTWALGPIGGNFRSVSCPPGDVTNCYVAGSGGVVRYTSNGGNTYAFRDIPQTFKINSVFCVTASTCYVFCERGKVYKTTNNGQNYTIQIYDGSLDFTSIHCPQSDRTCFVVGAGGVFAKTMDSGTNWQGTSGGTNYNSIYCPVDSTTCYEVGSNGSIQVTTNGGTSWFAQGSGVGDTLMGVHCPVDAATCYAVGGNGASTSILKTTNGGGTWTPQTTPAANFMSGINCIDPSTCYSVGANGSIFKTVDGINWSSQTSGIPDNLLSVSCVDANNCYAVGYNGQILKTGNGGTNWTTQVSGTPNVLFSVTCPKDISHCYASGQNGLILYTSDGTNWAPEISHSQYDLKSVACPADENTCYSVGSTNAPIIKKGTGLADAIVPTITNNQASDVTWRQNNLGTFDVDFADAGGSHLNQFQISACSTASACENRKGWSIIQRNIGLDSYTTDWSMPDWFWNALPDGTHYISARAYDYAGNSGQGTALFYIKKDTATPTVTLSYPADHAGVSKDFVLWATNTDLGSGLKRCYYRIQSNASDSVPWTQYTCSGTMYPASFTITVSATGTCHDQGADLCQVSLVNVDNLEQPGATVTYSFSPDWTPPTINGVVTPFATDTGVYVSANFSMSVSGIIDSPTMPVSCEYYSDATGWQPAVFHDMGATCGASSVICSWKWPINEQSDFQDGATVPLQFRVADMGGNYGYATAVIRRCDDASPTVAISNPRDHEWATNSFYMAVSNTDHSSGVANTTYRVVSNSVETKPTTGYNIASDTVFITVGSGRNCDTQGTDICRIYANVFDGVGYYNNATLTLSIDWTPPSTAPVLLWRSYQTFVRGDYLAYATSGIADVTSGVNRCDVTQNNGTTWTVAQYSPGSQGCSANMNCSDGATTAIFMRIIDNAGNVATTTTLLRTCDGASPTLTFDTPPDNSWVHADFSPNVSATDAGNGSGMSTLCYYRTFDYAVSQATPTLPWTVYNCGIPPVITVGATGNCAHQGQDTCHVEYYGVDNVGYTGEIMMDYSVDWSTPTIQAWVRDGVNGDMSWSSSPTILSAHWATSSDPESDIARYWYSIGTAAGASDVASWTPNATQTSVTRGGLALLDNTMYYFNVLAENGAGDYSTIVSSNGQRTDFTPPSYVASVYDGPNAGTDTYYSTAPTSLTANWGASSDAESGLAEYYYAVGSATGLTDVLTWTPTYSTNTVITRSGLTLIDGTTYYVSLKAENFASGTSFATSSNGVLKDSSPPSTIDQVYDGPNITDLTYASSTTDLAANWSTAFDAHTGVARYWYAIGTTAGATDVVGWTDNSTQTAFAKTGLTLTNGGKYYTSVMGENGAGLLATAKNSNGVTIDVTPPTSVSVVNDSLGNDFDYATYTNHLSATWATSSDPESGVVRYWYAMGTATSATNVADWTSVGLNTSVTKWGLSLTNGVRYYTSVKVDDGAGFQATATTSDGQIIDVTSPAAVTVSDGLATDTAYATSTTQLSANWTAATDTESGIISYSYGIGTSAGGRNIIDWTDNGAGTSVTKGGLTLVEGTTYYFTVKAQNGAGMWTVAANSNGQKVDVHAPTQSNWNPAKGSTIANASPTVTFVTNENATCKWALADLSYAAMASVCSGTGTTSQSCAVSGLGQGNVTVYTACADDAGNTDSAFTNQHVNYVLDTMPPVQSAWNPASGSAIITNSPAIAFTTNENAECRWSLSDVAFASMTANCTGTGTTSLTCTAGGLPQGTSSIYIACKDTAGNADTASSNVEIVYFVTDTTPPNQSNWLPTNGSFISTSAPVVTFNTDENADCKWATTDSGYATMTNDCTGDGTTIQSCAVSGLVQGFVLLYFACRDSLGNADTATSNEHISYTFDNSPPVQSNWSPATSTGLISATATISFTTNEIGMCRWSFSDLGYASMTNSCVDGPVAHTCTVGGLATGTVTVYTACSDNQGNADTAASNVHLTYVVDMSLPAQSNWKPASGAYLSSSAPTLTFDTSENADCKWALTDLGYDSMVNDCTGDGTASQTCALSGLPSGTMTVYVACADTYGNKDSDTTNQQLNYTLDNTPPANLTFVNDGTGTDIDVTDSTTQLSANWSATTDPQSGILRYWYSIGTSVGASNVVSWTSVGLSLGITKTGINLLPGQTYYFAVKAENSAGLMSNPANSDGQAVPGGCAADACDTDPSCTFTIATEDGAAFTQVDPSQPLRACETGSCYATSVLNLPGVHAQIYDMKDTTNPSDDTVVLDKGTVCISNGTFRTKLRPSNVSSYNGLKQVKVVVEMPWDTAEANFIPCDKPRAIDTANCHVTVAKNIRVSDAGATNTILPPSLPSNTGGAKEVGNIYCEKIFDGADYDEVGASDFTLLKNHYGTSKTSCLCPTKCPNNKCYSPFADIDNDGSIGANDFTLLKTFYGKRIDPAPGTKSDPASVPKDANNDPLCGDQ